jgi:uncharacterized protein (DUF433 family)
MSRHAVLLSRRNDISFGAVVVRGTGIRVEILAGRFAAGESIRELADDYALAPETVEAAIRALLTAASGARGFPVALMRRLDDLVPLETT